MTSATVRAWNSLGTHPCFETARAYWESYGFVLDFTTPENYHEAPADGDHLAAVRGLVTISASIWNAEEQRWYVFVPGAKE